MAAMSVLSIFSTVPVPEGVLRAFQRDVGNVIPTSEGSSVASSSSVKDLQDVCKSLLDTADFLDISISHRAAACNSICAIIERCQASKSDELRGLVLDQSIWHRLFEIYLEKHDNAKAKSMRQVLLVLAAALQNTDDKRSTSIADQTVLRFLEIISHQKNRLRAKPALHGLAHYLLKDIVSISRLIELYRDFSDRPLGAGDDVEILRSILSHFVNWVALHDTAHSAGHMIKTFLDKVRQESFSKGDDKLSFPIWIEPVTKSVCNGFEMIQEYKSHLFPACFQPHLDEYVDFLVYLGLEYHLNVELPQNTVRPHRATDLNGEDEFNVLLAALQAGKELGLVRDIDSESSRTVLIQHGSVHFPDRVFSRLLTHPIADVRLAALSLLTYSTSITRPLTKFTFGSLKRHLVHLHADTDATFRGELLSQTGKLFDRLRAATATLAKSLDDSKHKEERSTSYEPIIDRRKEELGGETQKALGIHLEFITWYLRFLETELRPTASYQRHITALRALVIVMKSGLDPSVISRNLSKQAQGQLRWRFKLTVLRPSLARMLLDLLIDPFDDVRNGAMTALGLGTVSDDTVMGAETKVIKREDIGTPSDPASMDSRRFVFQSYARFLERAEQVMLRAGRADHADGVARAYLFLFSQRPAQTQRSVEQQDGPSWFDNQLDIFKHLLEQLEETIKMARQNLYNAVNGRPIHGIFAALRYIVDQPGFYSKLSSASSEALLSWRELHKRLFVTLKDLWFCVQDVLCNDAPEGYLPDELEDDPGIGTKEISSYCWRGLKEASILLRTVVAKAPVGGLSVLTVTEFEDFGRLCFLQLAELRHRGAFSTVAQTFAIFCQRCVHTDMQGLQRLPEMWYRETLSTIQSKGAVITRRSGGIPSLVSGIISADPGGRLFAQAIKDLILEASRPGEDSNIEESRLPQVHAMNCLKEIFTTSRLSSASEAYIAEGLDLAAKTLRSRIWPIRNCGLMLLKSLLERLLGSGDAQNWRDQNVAHTSRFTYSNYPTLLDNLERLLSLKTGNGPDLESHTTEGVFPALQILQQAPPPDSHRQRLRHWALELTKSSHWHMRDMAARTVASLVLPAEQLEIFNHAVQSLDCTQTNALHGALLTLKYILKRCLGNPSRVSVESIETLARGLLGRFDEVYLSSSCPFVKAAYLDLITTIIQATTAGQIGAQETQVFSTSVGALSALDIRMDLDNTIGAALLRRSVAIYGAVCYIRSSSHPLTSHNDETDWVQLFITKAMGTDSDSCSAVLEALDEILDSTKHRIPTSKKVRMMMAVHNIALSVTDAEVKNRAQNLLAGLLQDEDAKTLYQRQIDNSVIDEQLESLRTRCLYDAPSCLENGLRLYGSLLDYRYHLSGNQNVSCMRRISQYVHLLQRTLEEANPFDLRYAALQSLSTLYHIWTLPPNPVLLGLSLTVYDALNDDDDEIRDAAAQTAFKLLKAQNFLPSDATPAVPIATTHIMISFFIHTFPSSKFLAKGATRRLLGIMDLDAAFAPNAFGETLKRERTEDTALFVQEKQNLFKDESSEILLWSKVLMGLDPSAVTGDLSTGFATWVTDGLQHLTETARKEVDGALGWTSKPEVFVLGLRVIYGAEVLLSWESRVDQIDSPRIRKSLIEFLDAAQKSEVHDMWVRKLENVVSASLTRIFTGLKLNLDSIAEQV